MTDFEKELLKKIMEYESKETEQKCEDTIRSIFEDHVEDYTYTLSDVTNELVNINIALRKIAEQLNDLNRK